MDSDSHLNASGGNSTTALNNNKLKRGSQSPPNAFQTVAPKKSKLKNGAPNPKHMAASVVKDGKTIDVAIVPTANQFEILDGAGEKMITSESVAPAKLRIPPITVFNSDRTKVDAKLKAMAVTNYSIKLLRHGLHVYCDSVDNFKKVRDEFKKGDVNFYSHELADEKFYKVVLTGLHKMDPDALLAELQEIGLAPVAVRIINPRNSAYRPDALYVVSFPKGTVKLSELKADKKVVFHTRVDWQPYKHRGGLVQCTRCQRPGHGIKHCNMPARCALCGEGHETDVCPKKKALLEQVTSPKEGSGPVQVTAPSMCCNCGVAGHFATDPKCQKRIDYINSRQRKKKNGEGVNTTPNLQQHAEPSSSRFHAGGASFAEVAAGTLPYTNPSGIGVHSGFARPSGISRPSGNSRPSGDQRPSGNSRPSGDLIDEPFTLDEISALTFEIINSLRDVQRMPRHEAMKIVMDMAFKFLYGNGR